MSRLQRKRVAGYLRGGIHDGMMYNLESLQYDIIDKLEVSYDQNLNSIRFPKGSFMIPDEYSSDFIEALYDMEWVVKDKDSIKFFYPNEENFVWPSNLEPIQVMVEGVVRSRYTYVELTKEHVRKIGVSKKDLKGFEFRVKGRMFYLVLYTPLIKTRMEENDIPEREYPLSKTGPIDIFEDIDDFVSERMSVMVDNVTKQSLEQVHKKFGS